MNRQNSDGKIVAFLGPDGAGKSTVLAGVEAALDEQMVDHRSRYFAPGFLKRYQPKGDAVITTSPHSGRQYGPVLVAAKLLLMLFEFRVGIPKVRRDRKLMLFDRFIHDLLVDPKRYRVSNAQWLIKLAMYVAPKPDLAVIVVAPTATIQARKQEVPPEETERQVAAYTSLQKWFSRSIVIDNSGSPESAIETALAEILV